jgi:hypothetical protein
MAFSITLCSPKTQGKKSFLVLKVLLNGHLNPDFRGYLLFVLSEFCFFLITLTEPLPLTLRKYPDTSAF